MEKAFGYTFKGCPFCGGEIDNHGIVIKHGRVTSLNVHCLPCHAEFNIEPPLYFTSDEAFVIKDPVEIWNTRKGEEK